MVSKTFEKVEGKRHHDTDSRTRGMLRKSIRILFEEKSYLDVALTASAMYLVSMLSNISFKASISFTRDFFSL